MAGWIVDTAATVTAVLFRGDTTPRLIYTDSGVLSTSILVRPLGSGSVVYAIVLFRFFLIIQIGSREQRRFYTITLGFTFQKSMVTYWLRVCVFRAGGRKINSQYVSLDSSNLCLDTINVAVTESVGCK